MKQTKQKVKKPAAIEMAALRVDSTGRFIPLQTAIGPIVPDFSCWTIQSNKQMIDLRTKQALMNTSLAHLPAYKQEQLQKIASIIVEAVQPEMVILFGSHATGRWV